ncbi:MAG: hypothetical protein Q8K86_08240 [Candidatus Nanopelagicaceae bacterium]|nr:hypothetical protein [Candidatus Nanopelagicaceae bacterium]
MNRIYVLLVNDYLPRLCKITLPTIERYAARIGAELVVITERKFPEWPITYEKLQIYELCRNDEWSVLIDADTVISDALPDVTKVIPPTCVGMNLSYPADILFPLNDWFIRDGRKIGVVGCFLSAHRICRDFWTPFTEGPEEIVRRMTTGVKAVPFNVDEYCFSCNLARYGLKMSGIVADQSQLLHLHAAANKEEEMIVAAERYLIGKGGHKHERGLVQHKSE